MRNYVTRLLKVTVISCVVLCVWYGMSPAPPYFPATHYFIVHYEDRDSTHYALIPDRFGFLGRSHGWDPEHRHQSLNDIADALAVKNARHITTEISDLISDREGIRFTMRSLNKDEKLELREKLLCRGRADYAKMISDR